MGELFFILLYFVLITWIFTFLKKKRNRGGKKRNNTVTPFENVSTQKEANTLTNTEEISLHLK